ncbi:acyl-homoserine-lactone synthase [Paenibacillus sp. J2TS4]|uniref:N-acyl amino acid synthase FeeM domain-containing protein n=1 Tax=Paenibacillus sp. J2TS4 TaxID=2807194 RepID=UPI001B2E11E5|nr:acyl-homoserine-lactone synthase [Paenibacillus sp. J2TS4]GIP33439.1 hypothetical protein J2TS4_26490 [Paenibacillus sp. J2TS4]
MKDTTQYQYAVAKGVMREQAIRLHHDRYEEIGFFKKNEIDPYEQLSTYFAAQAEDGVIVGVTRLIKDRLEELPTIQYFRIYDLEMAKLSQLDRTRFAEVSAFTKMPQHEVGAGLIKTVLQYSLDTGLTHWICCIDERVYKYMTRMIKFPLKVIGEPQVYLGSVTIPCALQLSEFLASLQQHRPSLYEFFMSPLNNVSERVSL